ncbi:hypothetical protein WN48_06919 [Eufriesea mexicana]|uniref:Uncharacterized protein n=1 Tax=Eufriesea mexicana TaxID=516756 RepID=A0A310SHT4_9HYME|nr:hypothetical protein WN48_06919 [Eufriesea mexicana]
MIPTLLSRCSHEEQPGERRSAHHFTTSPQKQLRWSPLLPAYVSNPTEKHSAYVHVVGGISSQRSSLKMFPPKVRATTDSERSTYVEGSGAIANRQGQDTTPVPSTRHARRLRMKHRSHKQSGREDFETPREILPAKGGPPERIKGERYRGERERQKERWEETDREIRMEYLEKEGRKDRGTWQKNEETIPSAATKEISKVTVHLADPTLSLSRD